MTPGKSSKGVMDLARGLGAEVSGWLSVVNRSGRELSFDVPLRSLLKTNIESYKPEECPLCREGKPVVKPGSRPKPK